MFDRSAKLERRVYSSYWSDGLLDVFAAVGVLLIGLSWANDLVAVAAIVPALLLPLWPLLRRKLIEPRTGHIEFLEERTERNRWRLQLVAYLGIALLILAIELYLLRDKVTALPMAEWAAGLPAWILAILALVTALLAGSPRFLVYALILVLSGVFGAVAGWSPAAILMTAGSLMLAIAAAVITRFLFRHPLQGEPET
jgi:hypothetical protein